MPEETVKMVALFDFFGDTLTEKQRVYFDLYYNEDLSLAEIAENYGVTRQGVYDTLSRACASLNRLEEKTGAVRRFGELRDGLGYVCGLAERLAEYPDGQERRGSAARAARELVAALGELKGKVS